VSNLFDKFYFIPGFFTLSLRLAFFVVFYITFMLLTNQLVSAQVKNCAAKHFSETGGEDQ
jgi:hypothetical protein